MSKLLICKHPECSEIRMKRPGNSSMSFPFCVDHQIQANLTKFRAETRKDKEELETLRKSKKILRKSDKQRALKLADDWFSRFIRFKYSYEMNGSLYCECYTCQNSYLMMAMDNGHWQKRENKATRFLENNARPQCTNCNDHHKGEYAKFELRLIGEIGQDETEAIKRLATTAQDDSEIFYKENADKYRTLCNQLFKERKIKNPWTKKI